MRDDARGGRLRARRQLLRWMALSPLAAAAFPDRVLWAGAPPEASLASASEAPNVFALEDVAREKLDTDAYQFLSSGSDDLRTLKANRDAFVRLQIRARRLVDVRQVDTGLELLGERLGSPILIAPIGLLSLYHPDAEAPVARAAAARGHRMIASTLTNLPIGEIARAGGRAPWFQLYPTGDREVTMRLIERAEAAGCPVLALTTDVPAPGNRETQSNVIQRILSGDLPLGNFESLPSPLFDAGLTWEAVDWMRKRTRMKLVLKGIVRGDDARRAVEHGVDALIVSNHGGRQEESNRSTLESLPEVLEAVGGAMPVLMDGGIRRGTDVFKALAVGADAVCVGRPYAWGLAAFGQAGVERALELLQAELVLAMRLAGTPGLGDIGRDFVTEPGPILGS